MPLRLKLATLFLILTLIPTIFVSILTFTDYKNVLEADRLSSLHDITELKAQKIESIFEVLRKNIEMSQSFWNIKKNLPVLVRFSHDTANQEFVEARKTLDAQLQPMQTILGLDAITLLNREGKLVYSTNAADVKENFLNPLPDIGHKAFEEGKERIYFTDLFLRKEADNILDMFIAAPARDSKGILIGVIVFDVNMLPIYKLIQDNIGLGNTGETLIGKKDGDWVAYLNPLRHDPKAALGRKIGIGGKIGIPMQKAVLGEEGTGRSIDYRGKEVISAWRYIPSLDWGIVAKIDSEEAFEAITKLRYLVILILVIIFIIVSVMAFSASHAITVPIKNLTKCAEIIGTGNLDCTADVNTKDEIGQLAQVFNQMVAGLKHSTVSINNLNKEIAQRKKAEEGMYRLASIVESSDDAIVGKDLDGVILTWNKGAEKTYGYTAEEAVGKSVSILIPPEHADELSTILGKIRQGKAVEHYESVRVRKDGHKISVSLSASPIKDSSGAIVGVSTIARDISDRKKLEELLQKYSEKLEEEVAERTLELVESQDKLVRTEKLAIVGKLASSVAHELRNPLGVIKNVIYYLNMLDSSKESPEVKENLDIIAQEIENSDKIITDLLEFSRAKAPVFRPENINLIIREALERIKVEPNVELLLESGSDLPDIEVDALQMHQVFYNLAKNALEAMEKGGRLKIKTELKGEFVEVSLSDTGPGIQKENLTKIFEPLFSTKTKGTGLGLSVCATLVERHNGKIEVESEVGKGTIFIVKLPVKRGQG